MRLTTEEKEKELNGKRYKVITKGIEKSEEDGEEVSHEMLIDLHYAWYETMKQVRKNLL